jgi:adenosylcobinamide-GDP ribazoletransferase
MHRYLAELAVAFALLTRLPVGRWFNRSPDNAITSSTWAYPVVGAVVGGLGGLAYWLLDALTLPASVCAIATIAAMVMLTGAFHEDGLADTADGFGAATTRQKKLQIMRDHCVGTYGVIALSVALGLRVAAIASLREPIAVLNCLVIAGAVSRAGMVGLMWLLPPARLDGLSARVGFPDTASLLSAVGIGALLSLFVLPLSVALVVVGVGGISCLGVAALSRRQIRGVTGDVCGAAQQICECSVLVVLTVGLR